MSVHWHHDDLLFEEHMKEKEMMDLVRRISKHKAPGIHLTTEQLMEAAIQTVKQMSPSEKAKLRQQIKQSFQKPALKWMHDDFLFEEHMREKEMLELAKRIAKHEAPGMHRTVDKKLLAKTADRLLRVSSDVLLAMPCDPRKN